MTPIQIVVEHSKIRIDKCRNCNYAVIYARGLTPKHLETLQYAYPQTKIVNGQWSSGGLKGFEQVVLDLHVSQLLDYDFVECLWMYVHCNRKHRAEIGHRIYEMLGGWPVELRRFIRNAPT